MHLNLPYQFKSNHLIIIILYQGFYFRHLFNAYPRRLCLCHLGIRQDEQPRGSD